MNKVCYIDVETTGLNPVKNDIIQIAGIVEINGDVISEFEYKCAPVSPENVDARALAVNKTTVDQIMNYPSPHEVMNSVIEHLKKAVNPYDRNDKMYMAGYNVDFDKRFMKEWMKKLGNNYFHSFFEYKVLDIFPLFMAYCLANNVVVPNHKLVTAADYFDIPLDAHDALEDIRATRTLAWKLFNKLED